MDRKRISLGDYIVESEVFTKIEDNQYTCKFCHVQITYAKKQGLKVFERHLNSKKHLNVLAAKAKNKMFEATNFNFEFVQWMTACNLPFGLLEKSEFTDFLEKISGKKLFDRKTYTHNILVELHKEMKNKIVECLQGKDFYVMVDESPDLKGRKIVNIMVGILSEVSTEKPFLFETAEMEDVNSETISNLIILSVGKIVNKIEDFKRFKLFISDGAPYCVKTGAIIKIIYRNCKHVICLAHNLHNLAETIRIKCPQINTLASKLKKYFKHKSKNRKKYKKDTFLKQPPYPILTRWGTFILFAEYVYKNFQIIKEYFIKEKKTNSITTILNNANIHTELHFINNYFVIPKIIKKLETRGMKVSDTIAMMKSFAENIKDDFVKLRYEEILSKNPDISFFVSYDVLKCTIGDRNYCYAPLTTVEVERSFSIMNNIITSKRTSMSIETFAASLALNYNNCVDLKLK